MDRAVVEQKLSDQATAIGVSADDLLDRLAQPVPGCVSTLRR